MTVHMPPEDALKYRLALEKLTHPMVDKLGPDEEGDKPTVALASIALSLVRVANALEKANTLQEVANKIAERGVARQMAQR